LYFTTVIYVYRARLSALNPTLNLENQVSVFISPPYLDRVVQLYPQASVSLFISFNGLQGYSGGTQEPSLRIIVKLTAVSFTVHQTS
jgi:hypothetical protein